MNTLGVLLSAAFRFWSKVDRSGKCWIWKGAKTDRGYGTFAIKRVGQWYAHRIAFGLIHGWLPPQVLHSCDNPPCCNPWHLHPGDQKRNLRDCVERGRHGRARKHLTAREARALRQLARGGYNREQLAADYCLSVSHLYKILRRKVWKQC